MKAAMGDYRSKMKEEEKKMSLGNTSNINNNFQIKTILKIQFILFLAVKQIKFTPTADANKKSNFVKKSAILTSGKDFKFNFASTEHDNNATCDDPTEGQQEQSANSNNFSTKNLQLTTGSSFKFNFVLDEANNEINFDQLTIKN